MAQQDPSLDKSGEHVRATGRRAPRDPETRRRDHDSIERLTDDVVPDLIDRLIASGLGEIEVREDDWRIRLRVPPGGARSVHERADRGVDRGRATPEGRGSRDGRGTDGRAAGEGRDGARAGVPGTASATTPGDTHANGTGSGAATAAATSAAASHRVIATSPAVGIFQPRSDVRAGTRVRAGDRLATVDLLGVPQDVVAPEDGVVVDTLAEAGEGVEYGQDLVLIEPARPRHGDHTADHAAGAGAAAGAGVAPASMSES